MDITVTELDIVDKVLFDSRFEKIQELRPFVAEAKVLKAVQADSYMWRNLSKNAIRSLNSVSINAIKEKTGVEIKVSGVYGPGRVSNYSCSMRSKSDIQIKLADALLRHPFITFCIHDEKLCFTAFS